MRLRFRDWIKVKNPGGGTIFSDRDTGVGQKRRINDVGDGGIAAKQQDHAFGSEMTQRIAPEICVALSLCRRVGTSSLCKVRPAFPGGLYGVRSDSWRRAQTANVKKAPQVRGQVLGGYVHTRTL
jgi:hypothetical protein